MMPTSKWLWMMDWCKEKGCPAAQKWAWDLAKKAFNDFNKQQQANWGKSNI